MARGYRYNYESKARDAYGYFTSRQALIDAEQDYLFELRFRALVKEIAAYWSEIIDSKTREFVSRQIAAKLSLGLNAFARSMSESVKGRKGLEELHARMAAELKSRVLTAYLSSGIGRGPSYRFNDPGKLRRYSNKQMVKALQSDALVSYDSKGIYFPNTQKMSAIAKQWYRLNFGAGPRGGKGRPKQSNMGFGYGAGGGKTGIKLNFDGFKPSNNFYVPESVAGGRGYWSTLFLGTTDVNRLFYGTLSDRFGSPVRNVDKTMRGKFKGSSAGRRVNYGSKTQPNFKWSRSVGGEEQPVDRGGALYVISRKWRPLGFEKRLSKGIAGAYFLDEGLRYLNKEYGQEVNKLFTTWFFEGSRRAKYYTQKYEKLRGLDVQDAAEVARRQSNKVIEDEMMKRRLNEGGVKTARMTAEEFAQKFPNFVNPRTGGKLPDWLL